MLTFPTILVLAASAPVGVAGSEFFGTPKMHWLGAPLVLALYKEKNRTNRLRLL